MNIFLVRHGETDANVQGTIQGWLDTALNERGKAQARQVAEQFHETLDAIYSSDLQRATATAAEFRKKYPAVPYFEDARLRERDFGDASGEHRSRRDWEMFWASGDMSSVPNAETLAAYDARVESFINELKVSGFSNVLIVTHGGTINRIVALTNNDTHGSAHENASVTRLRL